MVNFAEVFEAVGHPAAVEAMSELLGELSREIATAVVELPAAE